MIGELSHDIADYPEGIVLPVNKPYRWTSADVIRKLKFAAFRHFRKKNLKVGHAGTLDPLATGVLLVCLGPACKRAQTLQDHKPVLCIDPGQNLGDLENIPALRRAHTEKK